MVSSSRYRELAVVDLPPEIAEGLANLLWELGALGVVEEERAGARPCLRAFFPDAVPAAAIERGVRQYLDDLEALGFPPVAVPCLTTLADEDWARAWREHFRPVPVGRTLLVAPPWESLSPDGRLVITIEPGRAFGTGQHGSTAGCLEALEAIVDREIPSRALDLGTGSGILAIAAVRLGIPSVLALDTDPDAIASAIANAARNGVSDRLRCVLADARTLEGTAAPLVLANLLTAAHLELASRYRGWVAPGGTLVLGGVLDAEASAVTDALAAQGFGLRASRSIDGWTTLELWCAPIHHRA